MPVGVPAPGATTLTVAVNVTDWPKTEGFAEEAIVVELLAWPTVCASAVELLPAKSGSPL